MLALIIFVLYLLATNCCDDSIIIRYKLQNEAEVRAFLLSRLPTGTTSEADARRFLAGEGISDCRDNTPTRSLQFDFPEQDTDLMLVCDLPLVNWGFYDARRDVWGFVIGQIFDSEMKLWFSFFKDQLQDVEVQTNYTVW